MSTRATYSFEHEWRPKVTFYIHMDNYPEGAAVYFWNMHKHRHYKGSLADTFIKGNPFAVELTNRHEGHSDTEYRYYMDQQGILTAKKSDYSVENKFITFFSGHYAEFINLYSDYLVQTESKYEILYQLSPELSSWRSHAYLTLTDVREKVIELYSLVLNGCKQYQSDLDIWTVEYQRIKGLQNKS